MTQQFAATVELIRGLRVVWLPRAVGNLAEIRAYIAEEHPAAAQRVAQKIQQTVAMLQDHPRLGKPSLRDGFRQIQVAGLPFVIPYKISDDKLIIARIFHNHRQPTDWEI